MRLARAVTLRPSRSAISFSDSHISSSRRTVVLRREIQILCMRVDNTAPIPKFMTRGRRGACQRMTDTSSSHAKQKAGLSFDSKAFVLRSRKVLVVFYSNCSHVPGAGAGTGWLRRPQIGSAGLAGLLNSVSQYMHLT